MECHMGKAAEHACETDPRTFACCAHTQYYTWLRVARILSDLITFTYGDQCGSRKRSDDEILALFRERFESLLDTLPDEGVEGVALRTARVVIAWAWRGICEAHGCPDDVEGEGLSEIQSLADQTDISWATLLVCTPTPPPM
jgi:hypothetical protein